MSYCEQGETEDGRGDGEVHRQTDSQNQGLAHGFT